MYYLAPTHYPARTRDAAPARDPTHFTTTLRLLPVIQLLPDIVAVVHVEEDEVKEVVEEVVEL